MRNSRLLSALRGNVSVPGDKSISHRAVMFGSIAQGNTRVSGFLPGADCLSTIGCFRSMGIDIEQDGTRVLVRGRGMRGLKQPGTVLDCGNSGTTMRLMSGILSAQAFSCTLTGDASIQKRPMKRIIEPLSGMGADIRSIPGNGCAPLSVSGRPLHGTSWESSVASAQVKSAILLAGLYADGTTSVTEPSLSRDHTERMLSSFGASVTTACLPDGRPRISVSRTEELFASDITVPGDISSAVYFIAAGLMVPGSEILIKNVGINPTRDGVIEACRLMGAEPKLIPNGHENDPEPAADLLIRHRPLHGAVIGGGLIPRMIDELPTVAAMACMAEGETVIRDAAELRVKESDRIRVMTDALTSMGADVTATEDGMIIRGGRPLHGARIETHGDHRIAMTFAVMDLVAEGAVTLDDPGCAAVSYPDFYGDLRALFR